MIRYSWVLVLILRIWSSFYLDHTWVNVLYAFLGGDDQVGDVGQDLLTLDLFVSLVGGSDDFVVAVRDDVAVD